MKLDFSQKMWIQGYKQAEQNGGTFDEYQNWTPFEEIPVPEWYESYLQSLDGAGSGNSEVVSTQPLYEGSTPSQSTKSIAAELGRRGGIARAQKLSPERRSEIARLAGLRKGKVLMAEPKDKNGV